DLLERGARIPRQQLVGADDEAGRAEPALKPVRLPEGFLNGVQLAWRRRDSLNRGDFGTRRLNGKHQAASGGLAVEQDRARAAHPVLTTDVGANQAQILAQEIDQRLTYLDGGLVTPAIDSYVDRPRVSHPVLPGHTPKLHAGRGGSAYRPATFGTELSRGRLHRAPRVRKPYAPPPRIRPRLAPPRSVVAPPQGNASAH